MVKPLFRWTIGPCLQAGKHTLKESILKTSEALGRDKFNWMVCYNGINVEELEFVESLLPGITLYGQNWNDCPIPDNEQSIKTDSGEISKECHIVGGSLWKLCPPRLSPYTHEIIIDNDLIIKKPLKAIEEFLASTDKVLLLSERMRFYGRYDHLFDKDEFYNSGLIGLPPYFDFASKLLLAWKNSGFLKNLSYGDEQGLVTFVLKNSNPIIVHSDEVVELHAQGYRTIFHGEEMHKGYDFSKNDYAYHFTELNRNTHKPWLTYRLRGWF
jgi:hypothetical protein